MEGVNDPRELLVCARYEFFRGEPIEETYENFCDVVGNDAMAYRDFEFWWYRFKEGNFDLDYDRIKNPSKELGDMPIDIMEEIFEYLEWEERAICRKVSRKIREIIDNMKLIMEGILVSSYDNMNSLSFDFKTVIEYEKTDNGCRIKCGGKFKIINGADFRQMMYTDLKTILNNPKLQQIVFSVDTRQCQESRGRDSAISGISACLSAIGHQLNVECLCVSAECQEYVLKILPHVKPRFLEYIQLCDYDSIEMKTAPQLKIDKIVELNQWKQAKMLDIEVFISDFKIDHFLHFNDIGVCFDAISKEDVIRVKNTILVSPDFEFCRLNVESDQSFEDVIEIFGVENFSMPGSTSHIKTYYQYGPNFVSLRKCS